MANEFIKHKFNELKQRNLLIFALNELNVNNNYMKLFVIIVINKLFFQYLFTAHL